MEPTPVTPLFVLPALLFAFLSVLQGSEEAILVVEMASASKRPFNLRKFYIMTNALYGIKFISSNLNF